MKLLFVSFFISTLLYGQSNNLEIKIKLKKYHHLDSIDVYSNDYPTELIEGSGFIKNKQNKKIGSIGYFIEITKNVNDKIIRVFKSESDHYIKYNKKPLKSEISEIIIYYNDFQQPDLAKYILKVLISNSLVTTKTLLFDLKERNDDIPEFKKVKELLNIIEEEN